MMWKEFEEIAGYEVSYKDYTEVIEPMYMATEMSKQEFVKCIDRKHFEIVRRTEKDIIRDMKREVTKLFKVWGYCRDHEAEERLDSLVREYEKNFCLGNTFCYLHNVYEYPGMRGCSLPTELVLSSKLGELKRIKLIKM